MDSRWLKNFPRDRKKVSSSKFGDLKFLQPPTRPLWRAPPAVNVGVPSNDQQVQEEPSVKSSKYLDFSWFVRALNHHQTLGFAEETWTKIKHHLQMMVYSGKMWKSTKSPKNNKKQWPVAASGSWVFEDKPTQVGMLCSSGTKSAGIAMKWHLEAVPNNQEYGSGSEKNITNWKVSLYLLTAMASDDGPISKWYLAGHVGL